MEAECLDYTVLAPLPYCINYHSASLQASCRYTNRPEAWVHVKAGSQLEAENCTFDHDGYISDGRSSNAKLTLNMRCVLILCSDLLTDQTSIFFLQVHLGGWHQDFRDICEADCESFAELWCVLA